MLTGRKAFAGESQASVIGAILKDEPAPMELEPTPPRGLERIIGKCLAKDPEDRWYAAHDLMDALRWVSEERAESVAPAIAARRPWSVLAFASGAALAAIVLQILGGSSSETVTTSRYDITLPDETVITDFYGPAPIAFSPDGKRLVYAASDKQGVHHLYLRDMDRFESSIIPGTENAHTPVFSPDGESVLFINAAAGSYLNVWRPAGESRRLEELGEIQWAWYVPSGHLAYLQGNSLMAVPFDPYDLAPTGAPVTLTRTPPDETLFGITLSNDGHLAYVSGTSGFTGGLVILDRSGQELQSLGEGPTFMNPRFAPTGKSVSAPDFAGNSYVILFDLERGSTTRATFEGTSDHAWTTDGSAIAFENAAMRGNALYYRRLGESGPATLLLEHENPVYPHSYSPRGELAFYEVHPETQRDIWILPGLGAPPEPYLVTPFNERSPAFSPDGRFIAYVSDESGRDEVYIQPYPASSEKWIVSTGGGTEPAWTRGGRELVYRDRNRVMSVSVSPAPDFGLTSPQPLFSGRYLASRAPSGSAFFDVSPEGDRFVMVRPDPSSEHRRIRIVLNWSDELERLVP